MIASIHKADNGYTVNLHEPEKKGKRGMPSYSAPSTHVAETADKALEIVKGHMAKHGKPEGKKTDKLEAAAKAGYKKMVSGSSADGAAAGGGSGGAE